MGKINKSVIGTIICFLILSSCLSLFVIDICEAEANNIYVDKSYLYPTGDGSPDRPYRSIQYAIDVAEEGDNIYVFAGTYNETLLINKEISLVGLERDNVTIRKKAETPRYLIEVTADYVTLEDITITDTENIVRVSLIYSSADYLTIEGTNITQCTKWGIYFDSSSENTIGNNIMNSTKGVYSYQSNNNVFSNNNFSDCSEAAIKFSNSNDNIIYGNEFYDNKYGIYAQDCSDSRIRENTIKKSPFDGIKFLGGKNNTIRDNYIVDTEGNGIYMGSSESDIINNTLDNNQVGINLFSSNCIIQSNRIKNSNLWGLYTNSNTENGIFNLNKFNDNDVHARDDGDNQWYSDNNGNYWDDYNDVDKDLDSKGDVPYVFSGGAQDIYPLGYFLKPPTSPTDPDPEDGTDEVGLFVTLSVDVSDPDSELLDVYFYRATDNSLYGIDYNVPSGETASVNFRLDFQTVFSWYAVATDDKLENQSNIWFFTTRQIPPLNKKPVADPGGPYSSPVGEEITFDGSNSNDPDGTIDFYRWNFGDGSSEILDISPEHTYTESGEFAVTLTVVDNDGRSSSSTTKSTITYSTNTLPIPILNAPNSSNAKELITFDAFSSYDTDGTITNYTWNFGDGTVGYGVSAGHTYSTAGTYAVTLTVTDDEGDDDTTYSIVTVDPSSEESPGFELIVAVLAIAFIIYRKRLRA